MGGGQFFFQAFVFLTAAVVCVPVAKRLGLGSVLGYLIAGAVIGPFGLGLVGEEGQDILHFAEFGVVLMLFLIGLELEPHRVWRLRGPILGTGGMQVLITALAVTGVALVVGLAWTAALALGMVLALSSTAIVLQSLQEKGLTRTAGGRSAFAVLLFQDLAVIPMLAVLPLLATGAGDHAGELGHAAEALWIDQFPGPVRTVVVLAAVAGVVLAGRFLLGPAFGVIARTQLRELFTAAALLLVIGIALLMDAVGLSPALGTFLAGVVLANSEYRHELESDIEPFKGLMLGLFFIAVGASIDFGLVAAQPGVIAAIVGSLILLKFVILVVLGRLFRLSLDQNLVFAFSLAQAGEFGFVLISFSVQEGVVDATVAAPVVASIALTMALTPVLMLINERLVQPRVGTRRTEERAPDEMDEQTPVIIAGYGRFGSVVGRLLSANGVEATVLDNDSDQVDLLRRMGLKVFYGDATRHDLLAAAGANQARLLVLALDSPERNLALCHTARKHFPHLRVMARAAGWDDAHELEVAGAEHVYRETLDASLRLGADALSLLGQRAYHAIRAARKFRRHDEEVVRNLAAMRDDRAAYLDTAREHIRELEELLRSDLAERTDDVDAGWDTETLMEDARSGWVKDSEADEDGRE